MKENFKNKKEILEVFVSYYQRGNFIKQGEHIMKIDKVEVFGWEAAIRGMRNPLNSWNNLGFTLCI